MQFDLVFEGGGAKGMVFVGALEAFAADGHTFGRIVGTSAGAISAALLAAGYTPAEMREALAEKNGEHSVFVGFMGPPAPFDREAVERSEILKLLHSFNVPFIPDFIENRIDEQLATWMASNATMRHLFAFVERGGWFSADQFVVWFKRRLDTGTFRGVPRRFAEHTLAEFHDATGVDLTLVASDTTAQEMLILNHRTAPDLPLAWAVRMSMSIPLLWQEVVWDAAWGSYLGTPRAGNAIVDGGLLSNFPIALLVTHDADVTSVMGERVSEHVLGLLIDESRPVEGVPPPNPQAGFHLDQLRAAKRLSNLVDTMLGARDKHVMDALSGFVARLPAGGYGTTEFDMSDARRECLLAAGREAMKQHLANPAARAVVRFDSHEARQAAGHQARRILRR